MVVYATLIKQTLGGITLYFVSTARVWDEPSGSEGGRILRAQGLNRVGRDEYLEIDSTREGHPAF